MPLPIEETIIELGNTNQSLLNTRLTELSNLSSKDLECFQRLWGAIPTQQRRQILYRLIELAEENFELNFDSIFKHCLQEQDEEIRSKAIEGLWENEQPSLINPLINLLEQDKSEKVQAAAATALGNFALLTEHKKLRSSRVSRIQEALLTVIGNNRKPIEVRRRALEAVAPLSLPEVKTAIIEAYQSQDARLKGSSIYAMGKTGDPYWLPVLLKELASADSEIRYEATGACGKLEEVAAVPYLVKLTNDPDVDVQIAAIQALGKIGGTEAKECLERCLGYPSEAIRQTTEQALFELEAMENPLSFLIRSS